MLRELEEELLDKEEELRMKEIELRKFGNIEECAQSAFKAPERERD